MIITFWPGDNYELFYQDGINGWKSLGSKVATEREIDFLVPQNALLWLRNRYKGTRRAGLYYKMEDNILHLIYNNLPD